MIELAIIGPTASGKSDLAIKIAKKIDAYILSIDSLSIYKEIDIVSAKPSPNELATVKHFGINELYPDQYFSVEVLIHIYQDAKKECQKDGKNLIIVGGTSFYLKSLIEGLSNIPKMSEEIKNKVENKLKDLSSCYTFLYELDPAYMQNIDKNDRYRIEKALLIYEASNLSPSEWFAKNPPQPIIENLEVFNIDVERETLRERINLRTKKMAASGLIDEVAYLEQKYTREPNAMGAIGIVEVLEYLDGKISKEQMIELIATHTAQLAKRQQTFNRTQFKNITSAKLEKLEEIILKHYNL
jgi:tRNA dimethylallyltransferase